MINSYKLTFITLLLLGCAYSYRMVGYWGLENGYANQIGCAPELTPERIPAEYYSHLVFSFAFLNDSYQVQEPTNDTILLFQQIQALKSRNSNLKCMISLGGWSMNMSLYSSAVSTSSSRSALVQNVMTYLRTWNWDGVDFDWEYPNDPARGGNPDDTANYASFISEMRQAVESENIPSGKSKLELSIALPGGPYYGQWYDMNSMIPNLDFANIMAYNLHGPWEDQVYCSADWNDGTPADSPYHGYSINDAVQYFLHQGGNNLPAEKFNLGITFAGVNFELANGAQMTPGSAAIGEGNGGVCTKEPGYMAYFEVETLLAAQNITPQFDSVGVCKYFVYDNNQWVGYDDAETLTQKVGLVEQAGLGGISVWAMYAESGNSPVLQTAIYNALNRDSSASIILSSQFGLLSAAFLSLLLLA